MSKASTTVSLIDHFSALKDPRQSWRVVYPLREILLLVLYASLCGMEDFVEIRDPCGLLHLDHMAGAGTSRSGLVFAITTRLVRSAR